MTWRVVRLGNVDWTSTAQEATGCPGEV